MTRKEKFIEIIDEYFYKNVEKIDEDVLEYWNVFKLQDDKDKPILTDNGKIILKYLQDNSEKSLMKARDIAEDLFISSRSVSGSLRKLVADGFVEKIGESPVVYTITEKGKKFNIETEKEIEN